MASYDIEFRRALLSPAPYVSWFVLTFVLAVSGPFGTYVGFPLLERAIYWAVVVAAGMVWGVGLRVLLQYRFERLGYWSASFLTVAISAVLLAVPVFHFSVIMAAHEAYQVPSVPEIMALIFMIGMGVAALRNMLNHYGVFLFPAPPPVLHHPDGLERLHVGAPPPARLLHRVEPDLRGEVIRLAVRDHYVDVHTDRGRGTLLMRFGDAMAELEGVDGLQVHRSHWVASAAVTGAEMAGGRLHLVLSDGARVPVSRNHRDAVAERWSI